MKEIEDFDYILLDCGPGSTIVNVNGLVYSTDVLMPIEIGVDSVEGVEDFIKAKEAICQKLEIETRLMGAVMTKVDRRLTLTETILSHCRTSFEGKFFAQIRTDTNLGHARGHRQTIFEYDSRSRAAEDYSKMATDVIKWFRRRVKIWQIKRKRAKKADLRSRRSRSRSQSKRRTDSRIWLKACSKYRRGKNLCPA